MDIEAIKRVIKKNIAELMNLDANNIADGDYLIENLGADSIAIVQLFVSCQEEFNVEISESLDLVSDLNIQEVAELILEKLNNK